ncbi:MAG: BON domain-containing protein [Vicinamibacterales bacterium]
MMLMAARYTVALITLSFCSAPAMTSVVNAQSGANLQQAVLTELREDRSLRKLTVSVEGDQVTLTGEVRTFWEKNEALRRTFDVDGVGTVVSEIDVPIADDQNDLAEDVVEAIQKYAHYRMWDHIEGGLENGVVALYGQVTPERNKARELFERIAKIRGVQDIQMNIESLPPNQQDNSLRDTIAQRLFQSEHFERFRSGINTPFHIIVRNSVVTLVGYVQGGIERIEMERIVGQTQGVLRTDNQLQTLR